MNSVHHSPLSVQFDHDPSTCPCPTCEADRHARSFLPAGVLADLDAASARRGRLQAERRERARRVVHELLANDPDADPGRVRDAVRGVYGLPPLTPADGEAPRDADDPDAGLDADLPPWEVRQSWYESTRDEPTAHERALQEEELRAEVAEEMESRSRAFAWGACDLTDDDCCGAARIG